MNKRLLTASMLAVFISSPSFCSPANSDLGTVDVTGEVKLVEGNSLRPASDASQVVVWLVPLQGSDENAAGPASTKRHYRLLQHNKTFDPKLLVVPLGSIVDFPNLDPWFHNVFSLYQGKRFDLGLYQAGSEKEVVFDRPGPSFLFCNIHPQMTAVILTVNSEFFGISDKTGRVLIPQVPPGRYAIHIWYENAASGFVDLSQRTIDIGTDENVLPALSIPVSKHAWSHKESHKDKYGNDYDPKASVPAY
jgi:plastocyanin